MADLSLSCVGIEGGNLGANCSQEGGLNVIMDELQHLTRRVTRSMHQRLNLQVQEAMEELGEEQELLGDQEREQGLHAHLSVDL